MKKSNGKRKVLNLHRETVHPLSGTAVAQVAGGNSRAGEVCNTTSNRSVGDCTGTCPTFWTCAPDCIIYVRPSR